MDKKKLYRAHVSVSAGGGIYCTIGYLSPCGEWIDGNGVRWPVTREWCETEAQAKGRVAPQLAEMGAALIREATELLSAADAELRATEVRAAEVLT
jgi:hypothetical protein